MDSQIARNSAALEGGAGSGAQRPRKRLGGILAVVGIIVALAALGWWLGHRPPAEAPGGAGGRRGGPATTVGTARVETRSIPVILEALGTVVPAATVTVRPQVSGVIAEIRFKEGQTVNRGDVLAVIDRRPFQIALAQAEGQLQRDLAELDNAKLTLERYQTLQGQDSIAEQDVDTQKAAVKQLDGTVASDRANVGTARLNLDYCEIKTPQAGKVGLKVIDAGNYIGAGDAAGVAVITQVSPSDVQFTVPQDQVGEIQKRSAHDADLPVSALDRTRTTVLAQGRFVTLDNVVNTDTGTVRAKARFDNTDNTLFPSQFVNVRMTLNTIDNALMVPVSGVRNGADGDFVYVLNDDRTVTMRKVRRGQLAGDRVQIVEGLQGNETIVTEGGDRLKEGASVQLPGDKPVRPGGAKPADGSAAPAHKGEGKSKDRSSRGERPAAAPGS